MVYKKSLFYRKSIAHNTVIFSMSGFWASIFIMPQEVIDQVNQICRNFLLGGGMQSTKGPYLSHGAHSTHQKDMEV